MRRSANKTRSVHGALSRAGVVGRTLADCVADDDANDAVECAFDEDEDEEDFDGRAPAACSSCALSSALAASNASRVSVYFGALRQRGKPRAASER